MERRVEGPWRWLSGVQSRYDEGGGSAPRTARRWSKTRTREDRLVGQVLADRYRVVRLLGEGGMGAGLRRAARQHQQALRDQALAGRRSCANAEAVARFRQEAWSASSIGHENIIEIDDFGDAADGAPSTWRWSSSTGSRWPSAMRGGEPADDRRGARHHAAGLPRPRRGARQGHRPSRHEAGEHLPRRRTTATGLREDPRLRHRQGRRARGQSHR